MSQSTLLAPGPLASGKSTIRHEAQYCPADCAVQANSTPLRWTDCGPAASHAASLPCSSQKGRGLLHECNDGELKNLANEGAQVSK